MFNCVVLDLSYHRTCACLGLCSENMMFMFRKKSFKELINMENLLLSWIYYILFSMLSVVQPSSKKNNADIAHYVWPTRVRCARKVRQHYLCNIMQILWQFFQRMYPYFLFSLYLDFFYIFFSKILPLYVV